METPAAMGPAPRPGILDITPYRGGDAGEPGPVKPVKLSSNENCLGCSPLAKQAFLAAGDHLELYPDGAAAALRDAIGEAQGLDPQRIVCGGGSDELLQLLVRAYAGPGDEVLYSAHGFLIYRLAALQVGATPVTAPETDLRADVDALLAAVTERTRIVFLANPNNPTGTYVTRAEVARLHAGLPDTTLLVIDGAYAEYLDREDYESGFGLAQTAPNVVATRTFSKIHGLAALRLGWAIGPASVIDVLNRVRGPFNVNAPALAAGVAAIKDAAFPARSKAHNDEQLVFLSAEMRDLGLLACESVGNFVLLRFPDQPGKTVEEADAALRAAGLITRRVVPYGLAHHLRVTVGEADANARVVATLRAFMGAS